MAGTKKPAIKQALKILAERQGFEPWVGYKPTLVFKTSAFDHSAISPKSAYYNKKLEQTPVLQV